MDNDMGNAAALTVEKLIVLFNAQERSTAMWVDQWKRYKDLSGVRNAALAIGKLGALYMLLDAENVPEELIATMQKYNDVWDSLHIKGTL